MTDPTFADPFRDWPERTRLYDGDGELLLVFTLAASARDDRPWADVGWRPPTAPVGRVRDAVLDAFAGYAFTSLDPELAESLLDAGATELRHALSMSHSLATGETSATAQDTPVAGALIDASYDIGPLPARTLIERAAEIGTINRRAYPPGHPDHDHTDDEAAASKMRQTARGEILGPYLDVSTVATVDALVVGACLVVAREGDPPEGGPWVVDVFRDPSVAVKGVGRALLTESLRLAKDTGLPGLSLVVSHSNTRARQVYRSLGFADGIEAWTLALPGRLPSR
jgi:GNAT superfamily N-acetyltransferase